MTDDDKTKRREVIENNKAWRAAEPVRHSYIQELLTRKKVPDGTLRYLVTEIITEPHRVGDADERLLAELLGVDDTGRSYPQAGPRYVTKLTDARLPFGLLVQVAADNEQTMGVHTWRHKNVRAARWLTYLQTVGYTLSDIEQHVVAAAAPTSTESDKTQAVGETAAEGAEIITLRKRSDAAVAPAQADDDIADTDDDIADTDETTSTATDADPVDVS
jgi:ParB family chromosome partitioning protein